ncbi:MAG: sulfite exporter TauE/SafE family protein, partial [Betaproteobacteria bacterium]|nr:sulfite exporter TauE/SafE family protein [Betaproteobacteria bacterium]
MLQTLSHLELAYCVAVLLFTFALRGSVGFGGAVGLPLLALVLPVKVLAPAWSLIGIVSSLAIVGHDRKDVDWRAFAGLLPGCALGVAAGLFIFKSLDAALLARTLGAFVILYAAYSLWLTRGGPPQIP